MPYAKNVLILTEGVIPYLSLEQVTDLAEGLLARPRFTYWIAEYFHPKVYHHLRKAARVAAMKNAPFRFFPDDWFGFFRQTGWVEKETRYTGQVAVEFNRRPPMPAWAKIVLPFLPEKTKQAALRMSGYVIFRRKA